MASLISWCSQKKNIEDKIALTDSELLELQDNRDKFTSEKLAAEVKRLYVIEVEQYNKKMNKACFNRRPYLTRKGLVGLGPRDVRQGDVLCIIYGSYSPLILRPVESSTGKAREFELVGEAYCDGLMDGEALELGLREEILTLK